MKKLSENEAFQEEQQKLKNLKGMKKVQYIWDYYKIPIIVILAVTIGTVSYVRSVVSEKEALLYTTLIDMEFDDVLAENLDRNFVVDILGLNPSRQEVFLSSSSYYTEEEANANFQFAMALQTRTLADLSAHRMDVVLMDQKALDGYAKEGYLMDLEAFLSEEDPDFLSQLQPELAKASVIISDNRSEVLLNEEVEYEAVTEDQSVGILVSDRSLFSGSDVIVPDPLYLGVISNTEREDTVLAYLHYLTGK